ncbi:Y-family DNA polymerase [Vibrio harveyi]|uniref:Y-family DNA polymerase n=1 Tax=Vibrio harveyi TaxID=669 RepID=UPI0002C47F7C|nr:Y-family DNA polymerase [Vibrio harveyi]EMR36930.1 protein UmuC [Vibrio harveyi CAIM 1792]
MFYALVDANSFYASCEAVFNPQWRDKPIAVLSNNDGTIVALNRKAKEKGIKKFVPYFKIKDELEAKKVIVCSSNYELYADLSEKMMNVISRFGAPHQFVYSIDECFLTFENHFPAIPCLKKHGETLRKAVWKETRLPTCVGIAKTMTLCKIANFLAKNQKEMNGVCLLDDDHKTLEILKQVEIGEVWGIGSRLSKRLIFMGVNNAYDLAVYPIGLLKKDFNVEVVRTALELRGERAKSFDLVKASKQQIFSTRSVGERILDKDNLKQALVKHASIASRKLRSQGSKTKVMICFASSSPFDQNPKSFKTIHRFSFSTDDIQNISKIASKAGDELFHEGVRYYKIGVGLLDLVSSDNEQFDMFNEKPDNIRLNKVFDTLNSRFGTDSIFIAGQGIKQEWSMKRNFLTKQYTTKWSDIPRIKC